MTSGGNGMHREIELKVIDVFKCYLLCPGLDKQFTRLQFLQDVVEAKGQNEHMRIGAWG
jgi:hypothetical protein